MNYKKRKKEFLKAVKNLKVNAVLISSPVNVEYLTGFKSTNGYVVLTPDETTIFTDFRYKQLADEIAAKEKMKAIVSRNGILFAIRKYLYKQNIKKAAYEDYHVTVSMFGNIKKSIRKVKWLPVKSKFFHVRDKKTEEELKFMTLAVEVAEKGFSSIKKKEWIGLKEFEAGELLEKRMKHFANKLGFRTEPSFNIVVAAGENAAVPHHPSGRTVIRENQMLLLDWGAKIEGYCSDMTRTIFLGEPDRKFKKIYNIVLKANKAAIRAVKPGISMSKIDEAARKIIRDAGFGKEFGHSTGHGIGLEIHEGSSPTIKSSARAKTGMVVTIEPGIYLSGWGGIRIEDMVLVTSKGAKVLTSLPK